MVILFLANLAIMDFLVNIVGSIILIIFTAPINIINAIMNMNPILLNFITSSILSCRLKKHTIENKITIITTIDIKIARLGNSAGEKEEIVTNTRNSLIIVVLRVTRVFYPDLAQLVLILHGYI